MKVNMISAVSLDGAIGKNNTLLWHIPEDLKFYKEMTLNKSCVVGVNTYNNLPEAAKKNRTYYIVDGTGDIQTYELENKVTGFSTPKEALDYINATGALECIIVGGAMLYTTSIKYVDKCYITWVNKIYNDADAFFPIDELFKRFELSTDSEWKESKSGIKYKFSTYIK